MHAFASTTPEKPPIENKTTKAPANSIGTVVGKDPPQNVASQLNTFTAVGTAMIIVAELKYARASTSNPAVNIW
jgi:hypothetical protein